MELEKLYQLFEKHQKQILEDYFTFLRFQSISSEPKFSKQTLAAASWVKDYLIEAGLDVQMWETSDFPVVFATWLNAPSDKPTVMLYGHYDVQPVDPLELWESPPFEPTVRDGEVYARGAQDNKGQCFYVISALRTILKEEGSLPVNVKLCIEGGEEIGSPGLSGILKDKKAELQADHVLIVDVGLHDMDSPAVTIGVRGLVAMTLEVQGSLTDLHSGSHGGIVYNPNHALIQILDSLRDSSGKILVPEFYDDVRKVAPETKEKLSFDFQAEQYEAAFGAKPTGGELSLSPLESGWLRPTLEINGLGGGYSGEGFKTVIPAKAIAKISCRLVPDQDPEDIGNKIKSFIQQNTPEGVTSTLTIHPGTGKAVRTRPDSEIAQASAKAFSEVFDKPCSYILEGASIPVTPELTKASGGSVLLIGYGLPGDQIHAPNEHFGLERFKKGFVTIGRILTILSE